MSASENRSPESRRDIATLAPPWHTLLLVLLIVFVALSGALLTKRGVAIEPPASVGSSPLAVLVQKYGPLLLVQLGLVGYVGRVARTRWVVRDWLGPLNMKRAASDALFAMAGVAAIAALHALFVGAARARGGGGGPALTVLPTTPTEHALWTLCVAPCVAFAEEVVYRGYMRMQLAAMTRSRVIACILQALLFGLAHANQGRLGMAEAAGAGIVLGVVVMLRRSLWPAIFAHVAVDVLAGLTSRG